MKEIVESVAFAIEVGSDVFDGTERNPYDVERARITCAELLSQPLEISDADVWKLLLSSAVLVGDDPAAMLAHELADGGASAECPRCNRSSTLFDDGEEIWLEKDDTSGDAGTPDPSKKLPPEVLRLVAFAHTARRPEIVRTFELLERRVQCPFCKEWSHALDTLDALSDR
jgi:hypothetical protein